MNQYINNYFSTIPQSYTDELMHYGVLGMKWGKHKIAKEQKFAEKFKRRNEQIHALEQLRKEKQHVRGKITKSELDRWKKNANKTHELMDKAANFRVSNTKKYYDLKEKAKKNPEIKKTDEYVNARRTYKGMKVADRYYGKTISTIKQASNYVNRKTYE